MARGGLYRDPGGNQQAGCLDRGKPLPVGGLYRDLGGNQLAGCMDRGKPWPVGGWP